MTQFKKKRIIILLVFWDIRFYISVPTIFFNIGALPLANIWDLQLTNNTATYQYV